MIKSIITTTCILIAFLLFLSIEIGSKPIFGHIYKVISPLTKSAQNATEDFFSKSVDSTQDYSKKIFDNSVPKVKDSVKAKASAMRKEVAEPAERITEKEKKELNNLIKNH